MLYTISAIAVTIFRFDDFNNLNRIGSGAVTMRLIKLEYSFTLSIFVYNMLTLFLHLFIYSRGKLLLQYARPNTKLVRCLLSQVNKNIAMRSLCCLTVRLR